MAHPALNMEDRYTWDDYRTWPDDERYELIGGAALAMSPSPLTEHQDISSELHSRMHPFFKGRKCKLFAAPMDVRLSDEDIVQPDLLVVCDPSQIRRHVEGPPDLVVEIMSPGSARIDRVVKTELYARFGVKEYWIVTPFPCMVEIFWLQGERYVFWKGFTETDVLASPGFPDLQIELAGVFEFALQQHAHEIRVIKERPANYKMV
jgi:Uma2 family endonuclease